MKNTLQRYIYSPMCARVLATKCDGLTSFKCVAIFFARKRLQNDIVAGADVKKRHLVNVKKNANQLAKRKKNVALLKRKNAVQQKRRLVVLLRKRAVARRNHLATLANLQLHLVMLATDYNKKTKDSFLQSVLKTGCCYFNDSLFFL